LTFHHLTEVEHYAGILGRKIHMPETARLAALLHDMGKLSDEFIEYLRENDIGKRGSVIHSTQGAKYIFEECQKQSLPPYIAEIIAICIAGHHGNLMDAISPAGDTPLYDKLTGHGDRLHYDDAKLSFQRVFPPLYIQERLALCEKELEAFVRRGGESNQNRAFALNMMIRGVFSCLIDSDRYNAYCFETEKQQERALPIVPWDELIERLDSYLSSKSTESEIDQIRHQISEQCLHTANRQPGIYKLAVPTGGGKTLSGLRFALNHARKNGMDRIIYVVPYLSILDQNAKDIRKALQSSSEEDFIVEHHSNIVMPDNEEKIKEIKLLTSRWNQPIIITTFVQFMESVFSSNASKLRKFHNMANAVIIFDEVQSIPIKCIHLFNATANYLSGCCGSTILLCSATQPLFNKTERPICFSEGQNLIQNVDDLFDSLKRTRIVDKTLAGGYSTEALRDFVIDKLRTSGNCLVIVNTKRGAAELYRSVEEYFNGIPIKEIDIVHLSTSMCPAHRLSLIESLKKDLKNSGKKILCISTQLIEAGVDISFRCVVRATAGLDSIAQAAGRCNRNAEDAGGRDVFIVNPSNECLSMLPDIQHGKEITERILREVSSNSQIYGGNLLSSEALERYYAEYFSQRKNDMDYFVEDFTLFDLLSTNKKGFGAYCNAGGKRPIALRQAFHTAGDHFYVIEDMTSILVPYDQGEELLNKYDSAQLNSKGQILREMERYSVSIYPHQKQALERERALIIRDDGIIILDKNYYDEKIGLTMKGRFDFLCA